MHANAGNEMGYELTDAGKARALDSLSQSEYYGAMPVPLDQYQVQIKRQSVRDIRLNREQLMSGMGHLILPPDLIDNLGPAVTSGRSILLWPPGNGKSSISHGIRAALGDKVYVPRAIEYSGQIISVYDPSSTPPPRPPSTTRTRCAAPRTASTTATSTANAPASSPAANSSLDMLDLNYNPTARTYQAPLQLKATGGIFIIDDLGRQQEPPQKIVNRWIVPLEDPATSWPCNRARNSPSPSTRW